jgi:hypothetical protein
MAGTSPAMTKLNDFAVVGKRLKVLAAFPLRAVSLFSKIFLFLLERTL